MEKVSFVRSCNRISEYCFCRRKAGSRNDSRSVGNGVILSPKRVSDLISGRMRYGCDAESFTPASRENGSDRRISPGMPYYPSLLWQSGKNAISLFSSYDQRCRNQVAIAGGASGCGSLHIGVRRKELGNSAYGPCD